MKEYTSEDLDNAIIRLQDFKRLNQLKIIINSNENSEKEIIQKRDSVDLVLGDIQNEEAYKIFILLFGIDWQPNLNNEDSVFKLAPLINVIEKIPADIKIIPPWTIVKRFLYTNY